MICAQAAIEPAITGTAASQVGPDARKTLLVYCDCFLFQDANSQFGLMLAAVRAQFSGAAERCAGSNSPETLFTVAANVADILTFAGEVGAHQVILVCHEGCRRFARYCRPGARRPANAEKMRKRRPRTLQFAFQSLIVELGKLPRGRRTLVTAVLVTNKCSIVTLKQFPPRPRVRPERSQRGERDHGKRRPGGR